MCLLDDGDDFFGCVVHGAAVGVDACVDDVGPGVFGGGGQCGERMAGDAVCADEALFLEAVHEGHLFVHAVGPVGGGHAVNLEDVDVVGVQLFEEAGADDVGCGAFGFGDAAGEKPYLGDEGEVFAGDVFEGGGQEGVRAVEVGAVDECDAAIEGAADEGGEVFLSGAGVVGLAVAAAHSGADADARDLEAGFAEGDDFGGVKAGGSFFVCGVCGAGRADGGCADADERLLDELASSDCHFSLSGLSSVTNFSVTILFLRRNLKSVRT